MAQFQVRSRVSAELKENFSTRFYLRTNASFAVSEKGPIEHYTRVGENNGAKPTPYFTPSWWKATHGLDRGDKKTAFENYLVNYSDLAPSEEYSLIRSACFADDEEFSSVQASNGRSRNGLLDFAFIRAQAGNHAKAPDPICLYLRLSGEGYAASPSRLFDGQYYSHVNKDAGRRGLDPLVHFLKIGFFENRKPTQFLRIKNHVERQSDRSIYLRDVYSPSEIFEMDAPYEMVRGDLDLIGRGTAPIVSSNLFFGEPQLIDSCDLDLMFDVYQTFMEARK